MRNGYNSWNGFTGLAREIDRRVRPTIRYFSQDKIDADLSPVYIEGQLFNGLVKWMGEVLDECTQGGIDFVAGPEVDGLGLAGALARSMSGEGKGTGYLMVRKGVGREKFDEEYTTTNWVDEKVLFIPKGITKGKRCVIVDDSANTYRTIIGCGNLIGEDGGDVLAAVSLVRFVKEGEDPSDRTFELYCGKVPSWCLLKYKVEQGDPKDGKPKKLTLIE